MQLPGLIIGGGIAGLTAAIALQQRGLAVQVCEAAPRILPLGAGIWMAPNAMQVFDRLGLAGRVNAGGVPLRDIQIVDARLRPLLRTNQERIREQFGFTTTAIRRAVLQDILLGELDSQTVLLSREYAGLQQDEEEVTVRFTDGSSLRGAFVIAADGIHSPVRGQLFPEVRFRSTGHLVWRGMTPIQLRPAYKQVIMEAWGRGVRFGFSEIADGLVDWFAVVAADSIGEDRAQLKARLQRLFAGFAYPIPDILAQADESRIIRNEIADFDPISSWSRGKVCLIGDAAHASTPYMGQGGCQAVEDAYVLAQCLQREPSAEQAFAAMQQLRWARATHVQRTSRLLGRVGYLQQAPGVLRDLIMRSTPGFIIEQQFRRVYELNY
ncbi:FAD-dependent monooxygenase [Hymenobacter saemangeumensis]|uniref:FAD-dependent monooxygenase n=1 Tax=Hymenobacter saemangeumensis TaxID=1084522 RepID=A0ABP8I3Q7_9BACT